MDTTSLKSTLNKAREQFKNGLAKACVETMDGMLADLKISEPEWYRLRNDTSFLLARLSGLERERGMISEQNYMVEWNKLFHSTNQLLLDFEAGVKEMGERETVEEKRLYKAELVLGLDYKKTDMEEVKGRILRIENMLNMQLDLPERITGTRAGSVLVELELYAEEIVRIKSLVKLGLVDDVVGFKVLEDGWDWIEGEDFVLWLEKVTIEGENLSSDNPHEVKPRFGFLDLIYYNLWGPTFIGFAGMFPFGSRGTIFINLRGATLYNANLRNATLRFVDLREADLNGADLRGAKFHNTIFHINQLDLLKKMNVDTSKAIFFDDEGKKVKI